MNPGASVSLGALQGLTEFLPVSSSAHLYVAHWYFGWTLPKSQELAFDVALHAGTLLALMFFLRGEWKSRVAAGSDMRRLCGLTIIASIPAALAGVLLEDAASSLFRNPVRVAGLLAIMGAVMWWAEAKGRKTRPVEEFCLRDALILGVCQTLALMPGVSRSGITITTGLACGFRSEAAARLSFLMAIPITGGAVLWEARHFDDLLNAGIGGSLIAGVVSAAVFGYFAIDRLLKYLRTRSLTPFVIYRIMFAAAIAFSYYRE